jgi:hypothetical protein
LPSLGAAVAPVADAATAVATTAAITASSRMATGRRPARFRAAAPPVLVLLARQRIPTLLADPPRGHNFARSGVNDNRFYYQ